MSRRHTAIALALLLAASALSGTAAGAAVLCQKGKALKLRTDDCKPKETRVTSFGDDGLTGIWERTGGVLQNFAELQTRYLVLEPDGSGELTASGGDGPVLSCALLNHSRGAGPTLVVDDWGALVGTRVYRLVLNGDELALTDPVGETARFERAAEVDPAARCETLDQSALFEGLPTPHFATGLAFDGTDLWYTEQEQDSIVSVDPATGAPGAEPTLPFSSLVHAAQGADFWTHCNCGSNEEAFRMTRAGAVVDTVNTELELEEELSLEAVAFQGTTGSLWLFGWNEEDQGRLHKVDASGEPDVLLQAFDLDADVSGMTFAGDELWALNDSNQTVMRIDSATGQVTGTFLLPDRTARWTAIASAGDKLFVLGEGGAQGGAVTLATSARGRTRGTARSAAGAATLGGSTGRGKILVVEKP